MKIKKWYVIVTVLGAVLAIFLIVKMRGSHNRSTLGRPDSIEVKYEGKARILEPGTDEYEEIFKETESCWESSMDQGKPLRVMLTRMDRKPAGTMEVTYHYEEPVIWYSGMTANTYTFFPFADDPGTAAHMYISIDGNYLEEAVVIVFKPTENLKLLLQNTTENF